MSNTHQTLTHDRAAGAGMLAFGGLTLAATFLVNAPGGGYSRSQVADFLSSGHRVPVIAAGLLALLALAGLVTFLAEARARIENAGGSRQTAAAGWGIGIAATAAFAAGWSVALGQVLAHAEGGSHVRIAPAVTYLISEIGVVLIFGAGAFLLGVALITLAAAAHDAVPQWLRRLSIAIGVAGLTSLAWAPFFLMLVGASVAGIGLLASHRRAASLGTAQARA